MSLPGMALAQRTTVTSCLSPSSFRLVSKDSGLSGWAWSCPALTTAGSMVCKTLSRETQERRVGGMPKDSAWDAAKDVQTVWYPGQKKNTKVFSVLIQNHTWAYVTLILTLSPGSGASRLQDDIFHSAPFSLFCRPPQGQRMLLLSGPRLCSSLQFPT